MTGDLYCELFDAVGVALFLHDPRTRRVIFANPSARDLFALEPGEIGDRWPQLLCDPERPDCDPAGAIDSALAGRPVDAEWRARRGDGSDFWCKVAFRRAWLSGEEYVVVEVHDITEQRANEDALRASEQNLRITLDSIGDGVIATDNDGLVRRLNPVAEELTGWREHDAIGRPLEQVFRLYDLDTEDFVLDPARRARSGVGVDITRRVQLFSKDGRRRRVVDSAAEIRDARGAARGLVVVVRDITEAQALQEQLGHAQRMEAVGELAGGIAHDFNNLLQVILGYVNLVLEDLPPDDPNVEPLQDVLEAAERAATLTRQLLAFARRTPTRFEMVRVEVVVSDLRRLMRRVLGEVVDLDLEIEAGLPEVRADRQQVELALLSLCLHARSVMLDGGTARVRVRGVSIGEAEAAERPGAREGRYVVLEVEDEGPGVDPAHRPRIFEPFFRATPEGQGTGLGLASVDAVAQLHGGFVGLEPGRDKGTCFQLFLPVTSSSVSAPPPPPPSAHGRPKRRILVADDVDLVRALAVRILTRAGFDVVEARDGLEAEERFLEDPGSFDAVLLDVVMPHRNGGEVYRTIKSARPDLPVLFASAYASNSVVPREEAAHLLQKPYRPASLLAKMQDLLRE